MVLSRIFFVLILSLAFNFSAQAQNKNVWRTLGMIKFEKQHSESDGVTHQKPRVEPMIQAMDGDEIIVKGYVIPLSGKMEQSHFMFSAYPYANCFFCGKAGAESVMEVFTKDDKKVAYSDDPIYMKGTFKYLGYKPNDLMFELKDAVQIKAPTY